MEKKAPNYLLKIFSGPHVGAEVLLENGTYTIGRDEACDIILGDQTVAPKHLQLSIRESAIRISPLEAGFSLDGKECGEAPADLTPFRMVTIGTTHFSIGPRGEKWPEVILPDIPHARSGKVEPVLGHGEEQDFQEEEEIRGVSLHQVLFERKGRMWTAAGCGVLIAAALLFLLSYRGQPDEKNGAVDNRDKLSLIQGELKKLNLPHLQVVSGNNGDLVVKGYVRTATEKRQLTDALKRIHGAVSLNVWAVEDLVRACQDGLEAYGLKLLVEAGEDGRITIRGYVGNKDLFRKAVATLRQDIPALSHIDNQVLTPDVLLPAISSLLKEFGLKDKVRVEAYPGYILVKGSLTHSDAEQWERAKDAILTKFDKQVVLKEEVVSRNESFGGGTQPDHGFNFTLPIKGVTIGTVRYITTADGGKYFEGGTMENGLNVKNIFSNRIVLTQGDQEFVYYFGGE